MAGPAEGAIGQCQRKKGVPLFASSVLPSFRLYLLLRSQSYTWYSFDGKKLSRRKQEVVNVGSL